MQYHNQKFYVSDVQMNNFRKNNKNISKMVFAVTAFIMILSTLVSSYVLNNVIERHDEETIKFIAADVYDDLNTELLKIIMVARVMSKDIPIINQIEQEKNFTFEENVALMSRYLSMMKNSFDLSTAYIVSDKSKIYYSAEGFNKYVDVDNDKHDIWYKLFLDKNLQYDFDIDVDEINSNIWTIFVSARIDDANGNLLGVCGVGKYISELQNFLITDEQTYDVKINLVDQNGVVQLDSNFVNIDTAHIQNIVNPNKTTQFVLNEENGIYTVSKYMPELGLYLVVRRNAENIQNDFSHLLIHMGVCYAIVIGMLLIFIRVALRIEHEKLEDSAKKHGLASYADLYISTHLINLKDNSIHEISCDPDYKLISIEGNDNAAKQLEDSIRNICALESLKIMLNFVEFSTLAKRLKENRVIQCEFRTRECGWCKAYFIVIESDKNDEIVQVVFAIELIDEEKKRENELIYLSQTDLMTGLRNRGSGEKVMQDLMASGVEGMFCLMDADKFKSINDNYGHDIGDKVIKAIADCLKRTFRNTDVTMRLGGDEFAVYVVGVINETYGEIFIENLFEEIDAIEIPELRNRKITISLGAAFFTVDENYSFAEVYKHADSAAYESKKFTGNHHTFYKK